MLRLSYGSLVIRVDAAERAPLAWIEEFLAGAFGVPAPGAPPDHVVRLDFGPGPTAGEGPSTEIECFSLDGHFVSFPGRRMPDGSLALRDEEGGITYVLTGRDVAIHAPADGPAVRLGLLRVVREIATAHALRLGHLHLHAAAAGLGKGVVAIAGPRESGKTTLLLHALLDGKARFASNDRLLVDLREGLEARGMPTIVSVREETLARFPGFARRLRDSGYARDKTLAEAKAMAAPARPMLSPLQFRVLASAEEARAGPLLAAVFPAVAPGVERFEVRALSADEAAPALRKGLFLATVPERPAAAFAEGARPRDGAALDRLCQDLSLRIPCLGVLLGPRAYDGPSVWDAIRERIP